MLASGTNVITKMSYSRDIRMTSSNGNIFGVTGPLCGEFTGPGEFLTQRPVTWSFDVVFDIRLNKRFSKQPWGWWFETPSLSLWRHCNDKVHSKGDLTLYSKGTMFNTLRPRQNGRHVTDDSFKRIFLNGNVWILIKISLKFVPMGPINNIPALVQMMAWRRPGDKPLVVSLRTHICVTR